MAKSEPEWPIGLGINLSIIIRDENFNAVNSPKKGLTRSLTFLFAPTSPLGNTLDPSVAPSKSSDNVQESHAGWIRTNFQLA